MEKRNKILAVLLIVLTGLCAFLLFLTNESKSLIDSGIFKVDQLGEIDQIILESNGQKTDLHFVNGAWKVNEKYDADRKLITVLFATLEQAVPKREIGNSKGDSIANELIRTGVKVSLLKSGDVKKTFLAGGNKSKTQAYFKNNNDGVYLMSIPGYHVYVSGIFEVGEGVWRDKRIFAFNWRNFKDMETHFPQDTREDFHVVLKDKFFGIDGITSMDTTKVNDYLDAVSLLQASEFLSSNVAESYDSLLKAQPAFEIKVNDIADRAYLLRIYLAKNGSIIGKNEKEEVMLFEKQSIAPIAKRKSYFTSK